MSGLETAIRNALDRSDRADEDTRARIYQSARQALDAGLQRQGVTDMLIILQQRKRLEEKIREIETEETERLAPPVPMPEQEPEPATSMADLPDVEPVIFAEAPRPGRASAEAELGGATRDRAPSGRPVAADDHDDETDAILGLLGEARPERGGAAAGRPVQPQKPQAGGFRLRRGKKNAAVAAEAAPPKRSDRRSRLDGPAERAAKPRRRRSLLSRFLTWVVTLAIVAGGCWWFYNSGMVQSIIQDAVEQANQMARGQNGQGSGHFDPRGGFSDEWIEIFKPSDTASLKPASQARAEAAAGSEGPAARLLSAVPGANGDIAVPVPADLLRAMAGKRSTIALSLQAGVNEGVQVSVGCDFGSLGSCSRHRFTATQEKLEALFNVDFSNGTAPSAAGRIIINAGLSGANKPVFLYDLRILPGQ